MNADAARLSYLRWLSVAAPSVFSDVEKTLRKGAQLGELGWIAAVVNLVAQIGSAAYAAKLQKKQIDAQVKAGKAQIAAEEELQRQLVQINTARAQKGLPPVDERGVVIPSASLPMPSSLSQFFGANGQPIAGGINPLWLIAGGGAILAIVLIKR